MMFREFNFFNTICSLTPSMDLKKIQVTLPVLRLKIKDIDEWNYITLIYSDLRGLMPG